jgi:iron complex outermembrane receptor protein
VGPVRNLGFIAGATVLALTVGTAAGAAEGPDAQSTTNDIVVTGSKPVTQASAGTKSDTPIIETPQSISVITSAEIQGLGLQNLDQALRYVAGVTPETRGANAELYDLFMLRGFAAPRYLDGLKTFTSSTGYADTQVDVSRLDRVEVIKGPASVLYGQSSPGGLVALSSKLPLDQDFYGAVAGTYGTYDLYRVDADVGGRIGDGALWRLYGSANGADTQQTFGERRRETVSGAVTLGPGGPTSFTLLAAYSHDPENGNYGGAPAQGTLLPNPNGQIPTNFADGEPGDFFSREQVGITYIFNHDFGGGWAFRSAGRYQNVSTDLGAIYTTGVATDATLTTFGRASYATREMLNDWTFDNQLTGKIETGPIKHSLLIGVDQQLSNSAEAYGFGSATDINAYNPVYGSTPVPQSIADLTDASTGNYAVQQRQTGVYAQDQMALGGFRLTVSGRQDWAQSVVNGVRQFTYRVGGLYLTSFGLATYASYSTSFEPQTGLLVGGGNALPSLGKQVEAGLKYQMPDTPIILTGAWFRIEQTNLLTAIPNSVYSTQTGKVRSQGVEFEATAPLPHGFSAKAAFSRQNVRVVEDLETPSNVGGQLIGVGKGNASFNLEWSPKTGQLAGFAIGGAVRHVDQVYGGTFDGVNYSTPSYTLFDGVLRYDLGKASPRLAGVEMSINATNLFDKKYLTSCYLDGVAWCWYGQRRTVQGTIGYHW